MSVARVLLCQRVLETIWTREPQNIKHPRVNTPIANLIPRILSLPLTRRGSRLKFSLNPVIPTVYTGQSRSRSYNVVLVDFLYLGGPFRLVMIFSTSIDLLKSLVTVRCMLVSFHQNDDIVHFRSFQSIVRIAYALDTVTTSFR